MRLSHRDYKSLITCIEELTEIALQDNFPLKALSAISKIVSCDGISYNELNKKRYIRCHKLPADVPEEILPNLIQFLPEHPVMPHINKTKRALKISDFLPTNKYLRTAIYNEHYKYLDVKYQMLLSIPSPEDTIIGFALSRSLRDLTERDRTVLDMLNPVLSGCYRNAQAFTSMKKRLEVSGHEVKGFRSVPDLGLTRREIEILRWVASGKTNRDIAAILAISNRTVQKHLEHIYLKLGVENRTAAAALAMAESGDSFPQGNTVILK